MWTNDRCMILHHLVIFTRTWVWCNDIQKYPLIINLQKKKRKNTQTSSIKNVKNVEWIFDFLSVTLKLQFSTNLQSWKCTWNCRFFDIKESMWCGCSRSIFLKFDVHHYLHRAILGELYTSLKTLLEI